MLRTKPRIDPDIGVVRRIWRGRIWYGAEWYVTVAGGLILLTIATATLIAPLIAPHDPNEFIGAPFTPPGGGQQALVARQGQSPVASLADVADPYSFGAQRNRNGTNLAKELNLSSQRFRDQDQLIQALKSGSVDLILVDQALLSEITSTYSELEIVEEHLGRSYLLGTDNLGRDILSRLIWARALSSA